MGFRFWRRIRIAPGLTVNLSKRGASLSIGPPGLKFTVGGKRKRATVGLPGTGLFYTTTFGGPRGARRGARPSTPSAGGSVRTAPAAGDRLTLGFFRRLLTPPQERALVEGCRELLFGEEQKALEHLRRAVHLADGAYLAGVLALKRGLWAEAEEYLTSAAGAHRQLGRHFAKYGISAVTSLPITEEVTAHVGPDLRGVLLALVEVYQARGRWREAVRSLERLRRLEPEDPVVMLSLVELLLDALPAHLREEPGEGARRALKPVYERVLRLTRGVENETPIHTAILLYKARALRGLGLLEAAREVLTTALRRKKDRPEELLRALRYERALVYEALGRHRRARSDLERLYAEAPDYEDVAARLGL